MRIPPVVPGDFLVVDTLDCREDPGIDGILEKPAHQALNILVF
jgi:hypothetical protein